MKLKFYVTGIFAATMLLFNSCKKTDKPWPAQAFPFAIVNTSPVTSIGEVSAKCGGVVTSEGTTALTAVGICWDTKPAPTTLKGLTKVGAGVGTFEAQLNGLDPSTKYYVRAYATNATGTKYGEEMSFTTLPKWTAVYTPISNAQINAIVTNGTSIFLATSGGNSGILRSTDNGTTFLPMNLGVGSSYGLALLIVGQNIFAGMSNGVFISTNNGSSWASASAGMISNGGISVLAANGPNIFAGTYNAGLFLSSNNGNSWKSLNDSVMSILNIGNIVVKGNNIFVGTGNGMFVSANNGSDWTRINQGLPTNPDVTEVFSSGSAVYACINNAGIYKSSDNGQNWTYLSSSSLGSSIISSVQNGSLLFVGGTDGVDLSSDEGDNWSSNSTGLNNLRVTALGQKGNTIYAGTFQGGLFKKDLP